MPGGQRSDKGRQRRVTQPLVVRTPPGKADRVAGARPNLERHVGGPAREQPRLKIRRTRRAHDPPTQQYQRDKRTRPAQYGNEPRQRASAARVTVPAATARQQMFPYRVYHCWRLALPLSRKINAEILLRVPQGKSGRVKVGMINALDKSGEARTDDASPPCSRGCGRLSRRRFWGSGTFGLQAHDLPKNRQTHRWRKADSNPWSPLHRRRLRDRP